MKTTNPKQPAHLLYIDASPRGDRSQSRKIGNRFLTAWKAIHPEAQVTTRDVGREPPPFVSEAWVEGAFTPPENHSAPARDAIAVSDAYVDELVAANEIVIATPIYNLSLPAALKAWIDQIVRVGRTFAKTANGFEGLLQGKRVIVIVSSGSDFRPGTPGAAYNFLEPYLRAVLGFIGLTNIQFVYAHSQGAADTLASAAAAEASATLEQLVAA